MFNNCTLAPTISYYLERKTIQGRKTTSGHVIKANDVSIVLNSTLKSLKIYLLSLFKFNVHYFVEFYNLLQ